MPANQQKVWNKARETIDFAKSVAYTNVRGKECHDNHSTYVCYGHHNDPLVTALGHYSLLPNTPYDIQKQVHEEIGNIVVALEDTLRSVLYSIQSSNIFLDVNDKYQIPEVFDHTHLD
jgi:hypothetical protein